MLGAIRLPWFPIVVVPGLEVSSTGRLRRFLLICAICEICGSKPDFAETPSSFAEASSFAKASADKTQDGRSSRFL
ncbi:MAG: hypothetical protein ACKOE8_01510, partial [Opitutaceae bacterium]